MGWQTISKGLIIGLILGLVFGFLGGYSYKSLNAEVPLATDTTITTAPTELVGNDVRAIFAGGITQAAYAENSDISLNTDRWSKVATTAVAVENFLFPVAQAQATCDILKNIDVEAMLGQILNAYLVDKLGVNPLCAQLTWNGAANIDYGIYLSGSTLYGSLTFDAEVTVTITWFDKDCVKRTKTETIRKGDTITVKIVGGKFVVVTKLPPDAIKLCGGRYSLPISGTIGDFKKCPCKNAINQDPA